MTIEANEALLAKVEDAKVLLSKDADGAAALLRKAAEKAKALLSQAAETIEADEPAKVLLSKATEDAKALLDEAAETAEVLLARVKRLEGIVPICSFCKKIRDDQNSWQQLEQYLSEHSEALFSHGICPNCMEEQMSDVQKL